jgi:hypothetical protein
MADCCSPKNETDCCAVPVDQLEASPICQTCEQKAKAVQHRTLEHLLKPEASGQIQDTTYRFCATPTCDVVYFSNATKQYFRKSDTRVRVGLKETENPIPVCYCFDYTVRDIEEEVQATGSTTIPDRIRVEVKAKTCHCEVENPQGSCCLGNVSKAVKQVMAETQVPV